MKWIGPDGKHLSDTAKEATYVHHQDAAATVWTVNHPLSKWPAVALVDSTNNVFLADIKYISNSQLTVTLSAPTTGKVYLN